MTNPLANLNINWDELAKGLSAEAFTQLKGLMQGATEDLQAFVVQIGQDQVKVLRETDETKKAALQAELLGQLRVVGETNRLRADDAAWAEVTSVVNTIAGIATRVLIAVAAAAV